MRKESICILFTLLLIYIGFARAQCPTGQCCCPTGASLSPVPSSGMITVKPAPGCTGVFSGSGFVQGTTYTFYAAYNPINPSKTFSLSCGYGPPNSDGNLPELMFQTSARVAQTGDSWVQYNSEWNICPTPSTGKHADTTTTECTFTTNTKSCLCGMQ